MNSVFVVDPLREIDALVEFDGRWPGTDAERRAAGHLVERLRALGREAELEPTRIRPGYPLTHLLHALIGIAGSVVSVRSPLAGVLLVLFATVSTFGDLTGSFFIVRRLTPGRASQNVVSHEDGGKPGLLVVSAHYDAARTGAVFGRRSLERAATLSKLIRRPLGPFAPFFWSLVVILVCCLLRLISVDPLPLIVLQFVGTVVLIVSVPLLADIALSGVVPGANDNASGVATALRLAERFGGGSLQHFDLMVLLPGAEEGFLLGMRAWLRRHKKELDRGSTVFVNIDTVGHGTVRWQTKSGFIFPLAFHPTLLGLCDELGEEHNARGVPMRVIADAYAARSAGYPAISIGCLNAMDYVPTYHQYTDTPENVDIDALDRAFLFCSDLIELIDERIGPDLAHDTPETVLSEEG
ncbi:MAG TPA: M28 family peptidase [Thermoleophilaceae bacterium]